MICAPIPEATLIHQVRNINEETPDRRNINRIPDTAKKILFNQ